MIFPFNEKLLQFFWQYRLLQSPLLTIDHKEIEVVHVGTLNRGEGPDFLEAKIKTEHLVLVGNIEIDKQSTSWKNHHHNANPNYKNIILYLVWHNDAKPETIPSHVPVVELQGFVSKILLQRYQLLMDNKTGILCKSLLQKTPISPIVLESFFDKLVVERLAQKTQRIQEYLQQSEQHWEQVFFILLMKNFGYTANEKSFEELAVNTDIKIFAKNKHAENSIYAILLGQANLLQQDFQDAVPQVWKKEYIYLQKKYQLKPIQQPVQFGRMLPANFPTIRLAQMAALIYRSKHLFSKIIAMQNIADIIELFDGEVHAYFDDHYVLDKQTTTKSNKKIGKQLMDNILINTIIPSMFVYGKMYQNESLVEKSLRWLEQIPAEQNAITKSFQELKWNIKKANQSQALIQLYKNYCVPKKCLDCTIAYEILKNKEQ